MTTPKANYRKYCWRCGKKMQKTTTRIPGNYDHQTGEKLYKVQNWIACPQWDINQDKDLLTGGYLEHDAFKV